MTRYREALESGRDPESSVVVALDTVGRAVLFAGSTVVIALLGLLVLNTETFRGVAIGTAIGVLVTMLGSVTLLPALLGFVGRNIDRFGLPRRKQRDGRNSFWHRWAAVVQKRRWPAFLGALVLLIVMALPVFSMRLGFGDSGNKPKGDTSREAYDLLAKGFGPGFNGPLLLAAETPGGAADLAALNQLSQTLNSTPGVAFASPPRPNAAGDAAIMQVVPTTSPQDKATDDLVDRVRHQIVPAAIAGTDVTIVVGGLPAAVDDFANYTFRMLPLVVGLVLLLSFILLMVVFRSVLVPLKAVVMNLLSVGAAYGVMVAVFQWGWGANLIGVGKEGPIEAWAPLMLFAVVFGLSMDYEVFLLSRIKEEYDRTGDNAQAVADGLAVTARVITAAAAIMVCVFGAFVLGPDRALKVFGLGMAVAVLIDATIVRLVLVPATMELLGDRNWWIPKWLDRILPRIHIEGHPDLDVELAELTGTRRQPRLRPPARARERTGRAPESRPAAATRAADARAAQEVAEPPRPAEPESRTAVDPSRRTPGRLRRWLSARRSPQRSPGPRSTRGERPSGSGRSRSSARRSRSPGPLVDPSRRTPGRLRRWLSARVRSHRTARPEPEVPAHEVAVRPTRQPSDRPDPAAQEVTASKGSRPRRARTSGRRSGGSAFGGWRRAGRSASRCSVMWAIRSAASSIAAAASPLGFATPDTLRTN